MTSKAAVIRPYSGCFSIPESSHRLSIAAVSFILAAFLGVVSPTRVMKDMKSASVTFRV